MSTMGFALVFLWFVFFFPRGDRFDPYGSFHRLLFSSFFFSVLPFVVPSLHGIHENSIRSSSCFFADVSCSFLVHHAPVGSFAVPCRPSFRPAPRLRTSWLDWTPSCYLRPRMHRFRWPVRAATSSKTRANCELRAAICNNTSHTTATRLPGGEKGMLDPPWEFLLGRGRRGSRRGQFPPNARLFASTDGRARRAGSGWMHGSRPLLSTTSRASRGRAILPLVGRRTPLAQVQGMETPFWREDNVQENPA